MIGKTAPASQYLEQLFEQCFFEEYRTRLVGAAPEPVYQPAVSAAQYHTIYYREDFFASALHEVAHWCIAGSQRRVLTDYGYWYLPDGRMASQQRRFEQVECKPQALEWHFSRACKNTFRVSSDNLNSSTDDSLQHFTESVRKQAVHFCHYGLPLRAARYCAALSACFGGTPQATANDFAPVRH